MKPVTTVSGSPQGHWGNGNLPVPQSIRIWARSFATKPQQNTTKREVCAYFLACTVCVASVPVVLYSALRFIARVGHITVHMR